MGRYEAGHRLFQLTDDCIYLETEARREQLRKVSFDAKSGLLAELAILFNLQGRK